MWVMVMFDLPVGTKPERREASEFRNFLLDQGFEMCQFSVYVRFCAGRELADTQIRRVGAHLPQGGHVDILCFTDKQYENIVSFTGARRNANRKKPEQYVLF